MAITKIFWLNELAPEIPPPSLPPSQLPHHINLYFFSFFSVKFNYLVADKVLPFDSIVSSLEYGVQQQSSFNDLSLFNRSFMLMWLHIPFPHFNPFPLLRSVETYIGFSVQRKYKWCKVWFRLWFIAIIFQGRYATPTLFINWYRDLVHSKPYSYSTFQEDLCTWKKFTFQFKPTFTGLSDSTLSLRLHNRRKQRSKTSHPKYWKNRLYTIGNVINMPVFSLMVT